MTKHSLHFKVVMLIKIIMELEQLLSQQLVSVFELIQCMPTPIVWEREFNKIISEYHKANIISPDPAINYVRSGIKEYIKSMIEYASKHVTVEFKYIKKIGMLTDQCLIMTLDEIIDSSGEDGLIKVSPKHVIENIEMMQEQIDLVPKFKFIETDSCPCGGTMFPDYDLGTLNCDTCERIVKSAMHMFVEDRSIGMDNNTKSKSNTYKTSKHFENWMSKILATFIRPGSSELLPAMREYFQSNQITRDRIDYESIRKYLQNNGHKDFYGCVAWFLKEVTGRNPPELTDEERMDISYRFDTVISTFDEIRNSSDNKPIGRTYYPFFIYKILETKFARKPAKLKILDFIHIQQEKTLLKNETLYKQIIDKANNPRLSLQD